jgi:hypothetical protein
VDYYDGAPPAIAITNPVADPTTTSDATINLAFTVDGTPAIPSNVTCLVNGVPTSSATTNLIDLVDLYNALTVTCTRGGSSATATKAVYRDNTPPNITLYSPAEGAIVSTETIRLNYFANDNNGSPTCTPESGSEPQLALGPNTITITCTDLAGNTTSRDFHFTRVEAPEHPSVVITSPANGISTPATSIPVHYTVNPVDSNCGSPSGSPRSLALGQNTITVTCTDPRGESASASVVVTRVPSTFQSGAYCGSPTPGWITCGANPTGGVPPYTVVCQIDGTVIPCGQPYALPPGLHAAYVCASDSVGTSGCVVFDFIQGGGTGPVVTINSGPAEGSTVTASTALFTFSSNQPITGTPSCPPGQSCPQVIVDMTPFQCQMDSAAWVSCTTNAPSGSSFTTPTLASGAHRFCVRATNSSGITGAATCRNFSAEPPRPQVTITSPTQGSTTSASSTRIFYTVTPTNASCNISSGSSVPLNPGANVFTVICTDAAGNSGSSSVTVIWNASQPLTLEFNCSSTGSIVSCSSSISGGVPPYTATCTQNPGPVSGPTFSCFPGSSFTVSGQVATSGSIRMCVTDAVGTTVCKTASWGGGGPV